MPVHRARVYHDDPQPLAPRIRLNLWSRTFGPGRHACRYTYEHAPFGTSVEYVRVGPTGTLPAGTPHALSSVLFRRGHAFVRGLGMSLILIMK